MFALEFPPLSHIVNWPGFGGTEGSPFEVNKIVLVYGFAILFTLLVFTLGRPRKGAEAEAPRGARNLAEMMVDFVENGIARETMGKDGLKYTWFLLALFCMVFFTNIFGIIPVIQMPASARIALPMFLALLAYVVYHGAGLKSHGLGYFKHALVPPGVPVALLILVIPIEFISKFLVQPFSHTVRLFANMLAGHILLVTFGVLTAATFPIGVWPAPFIALIFFTLFEVLVAFLQAYVFTLLTGVYINSAQSHEH